MQEKFVQLNVAAKIQKVFYKRLHLAELKVPLRYVENFSKAGALCSYWFIGVDTRPIVLDTRLIILHI